MNGPTNNEPKKYFNGLRPSIFASAALMRAKLPKPRTTVCIRTLWSKTLLPSC